MQSLGVELEERDELVIVLEFVDVHPHRPARIGWIRDKHILGRATVQLVHQPGIDCSEGKATFIICLLHSPVVAYKPEEFRRGRIGGKG